MPGLAARRWFRGEPAPRSVTGPTWLILVVMAAAGLPKELIEAYLAGRRTH